MKTLIASILLILSLNSMAMTIEEAEAFYNLDAHDMKVLGTLTGIETKIVEINAIHGALNDCVYESHFEQHFDDGDDEDMKNEADKLNMLATQDVPESCDM